LFSAAEGLSLALLWLSDKPAISLQLGDPALFRWEGEDGYIELEIGSIIAEAEVVKDLETFWSGQWRDWQYGFSNDQYVVSLELEREDGRIWLRVDYHHMQTHLGIDWRSAISRQQETASGTSSTDDSN
jgi:hypothetical protein